MIGKNRGRTKLKKLADFYKHNGLANLISGVTCHHNDSESCIDHLAVNRQDMFQLHGIIGLNASDHNLIYGVRKQLKIQRTYNIFGLGPSENLNASYLKEMLFLRIGQA